MRPVEKPLLCLILLRASAAFAVPGLGVMPPLREPWVEAAPAPPPPADELWGRRIVTVAIEGTRRVEKDAVRAVLKLKPGMVLGRGAVASDIKAVFGLGYFSDVVARAVPDGLPAPT